MKHLMILVAFITLTGCATQRQGVVLTKEEKKAIAQINEQKQALQVEALLESRHYKNSDR